MDWSNVLVVGILTIAVALTVAFVAGAPSAAEREQMAREEETQARRWADRIGLHVIGVTCDGFRDCTINHAGGAPFRVYCGGVKDLCEPKRCK